MSPKPGHFSVVGKCLWWKKSSCGCRPLKAKGVTQEQTANGLTRCFFQGLSKKCLCALWTVLVQELLFAQFLSREECSLCIVAHRVQKYARIAADFFGLRSFEVLGFGRATRLVSAMPVLILRLGRRMCGSATKERFGSWFGATFWCCPILSKRAQVEFWRQREGIPALDVFKQASSANERRRRIPHQALRAQDVLESSRNSSPLPFGLCQPGSVCPLLY